METTTRRRRALSTVLALFLAIESVSAVAAVAVVNRPAEAGSRHELPAVAPDGGVLAEQGAVDGSATAPAVRVMSAGRTPEAPDSPKLGPVRKAAVTATAVKEVKKAAVKEVKKAAKPSSKSAPKSDKPASTKTVSAAPKTYKGRNHVWIPALGINRSVSWFPCSRDRAPDNYVYRWGCAGRNNVYLLGHAWGVFKPLHDAYVSGRLRTGMKAIYADAKGRIHTYKVRWWKLTRPTTAASWAWASLSVPSMTLQTCIGRNSEYRLMVRLVEVR